MTYRIRIAKGEAPSRKGGKFWHQLIVEANGMGLRPGMCLEVRAWGVVGTEGQSRVFGSPLTPQPVTNAINVRFEKQEKGYGFEAEIEQTFETFDAAMSFDRSRFGSLWVQALYARAGDYFNETERALAVASKTIEDVRHEEIGRAH